MRKYFGWFKKKQAIFICANGILLIAVIMMCIISGKLKSSLLSQQFTDRWSAGESYSQVTVFLNDSVEMDWAELNTTMELFVEKLDETVALTSKSEESLSWIYGYSTDSSLSVKRETVIVEVIATGVGENFFMFHPLRLVSGSYIYGSDLMRDRVVIDTNLAWQLFGATNISGMEIEIGGLPYIIAGVVAPEDDFANTAAYGDKSRIYMSYEALLLNNSSAKITCLELLAPNPVENFTAETIKTVFDEQAVSENDRDIVDNTERYSLASLLSVMGDFGLRSMRSVLSPSYPYWENAARIVEDYLTVILIIVIQLLIFPAISLIRLILRLWGGRKYSS